MIWNRWSSVGGMEQWNLLEGPKGSWAYHDLGDFLGEFSEGCSWGTSTSEMFRPNTDVFVARAPGRLDVMGGIADYSGSLVLPLPLAEACFAAVQLHPPGQPALIRVVSSRGTAENKQTTSWEGLVGDLVNFESYQELRAQFKENEWAGYVAGCLSVLWKEGHVKEASLERGLSVFISSNVPGGLGVSSSAALEVSSMSAIAGALQINLDGQVLALLCQKVENSVLGVPCGIMDQMACTLGKKNHLLVLRCQPAEVCGYVQIPEHIQLCAVESGERHSLGSSDYGSVRAATFMGKTILDELFAESYLANIPPSNFEAAKSRLANKTSGEEFLSQYGSHGDDATSIETRRHYSVLDATAHAIEENHRVQVFLELLHSTPSKEQAKLLGELMYQSHNSYNKLGLGSPGTNDLVGLAKNPDQSASTIYGARITGGGSGGAVCFLCSSTSQEQVCSIAKLYASSHRDICPCPKLFFGSSDGAMDFGCLKIQRNLD